MLGLQSCGRSDSRSDYTLSNTYVFSKIHVGHRNCVQVGVCSLAANMRQQCASSASSNAQCTWTWEKAKKLPDRARQIVFWDDDSQLLVCRETRTEGDIRSTIKISAGRSYSTRHGRQIAKTKEMKKRESTFQARRGPTLPAICWVRFDLDFSNELKRSDAQVVQLRRMGCA